MTSTPKPLPAREAQMMKLVLKLHENKQYKKGLKTADQILKKFPEHAEAVAMKALFMSSLDRPEEAHELVKKAIKMQISNGVCWHVYGLIHRAEKNYEEALKCYTMSLKFEKENMHIFRDHTMLQIQTRNYEGFIDSNFSLVLQRPQYKAYWLSLVVSFHLVKNYPAALEILSHYHDIFQTIVEPNSAYENSEVYMYKNMIIEESGDYNAALEHLNEIESKVLDKKAWKESKARLYMKLGDDKKAEGLYKILLRLNPDCLTYVEGLMKCKGLIGTGQEENNAAMFELFEDLRDEFKRAHVIRRLPLNFAKGDRFKLMVNNYLRPMFRKGVPSVFVSIKGLYENSEFNRSAIESIVIDYEKNLVEHGHFSAEDAVVDEDGGCIPKEPPSALLWVLYFLAQHFDYKGDGSRAVEYIDRAIEHTPTLVELLMTKARILKHAGDTEAAKAVMNDARERDLQDRYINSKCTKYMLRNDNVEEGEKTISMFIRVDSTDKLGDLVELQCMWFAYECGKSFARQGKVGRALKKFHQIEKHFNDIYDDQFDFHNYSFRKMTIRTYIDLLRLEDRLRDHPIFFKSAVEAVKLYIKLFDKPRDDEQEKENINESDLSESEKKKALRKARKADLKDQSSNALQANGAVANGTSSGGPGSSGNPPPMGSAKKVDDDPEGAKLAASTDPLTVALKFLKPLLELSPKKVETHVLGSAVFLRRKKLLLAFKSLKKGLEIEPDHPELHKTAVQFWKEFNAQKDTMNPTVKAVIEAGLPSIFGDKTSAEAFNSAFLARNKTSLMHVTAATEVTVSLDRTKRKEAVAKLADSVVVKEGAGRWSGLTLDNLISVYKLIGSMSALGCPDAATAFAAKAREVFPLSPFFKQI